MKKLVWLLYSFDGRIGRIAYLGGQVLNILLAFLMAGLANGAYNFLKHQGAETASKVAAPNPTLFVVVPLLLFACGKLALDVKRLHDIGVHGAWAIPALVLFFIGVLAIPDFLGYVDPRLSIQVLVDPALKTRIQTVASLKVFGALLVLLWLHAQPGKAADGTASVPESVDHQPDHDPTASGELRGSGIVEEGTYGGRRWRRYDNGKLEGELLTGTFKEFGNLEEFKKFIS